MPKNKKYSTKNILLKATYSAALGFPISMGLNGLLLHWIVWVAQNYPWAIAACVIGVPYFLSSVGRQFSIDFVYQKYNVVIDPKVLIERLYKRIRVKKDNVQTDDSNTGAR